MSRLNLVVAGVGLIGKRHVDIIRKHSDTAITAIVDPDEGSQTFAKEQDVLWYPSLRDLFAEQRPDGIILATPNMVHVENGLECVAANCPILVEKPLATQSTDGLKLIKAAKAAGIPILVGHHRRHNPLIQKAKDIIESGRLGQIRIVHASFWVYKPDEYFAVAPWRKAAGAGPIAVNLVHDVDLLRYLCGEVVSVQAQAIQSFRGYENEDVAAAIIKFASGALGTISASDMVAAPWSWEMTARENVAYPATDQSCYWIGGTQASMSLPDFKLWENPEGKHSWLEPLLPVTTDYTDADPLVRQIDNFVAVIRREAAPVVSGEEGVKTLQVIEAIQLSAKFGGTINLA